MSSKGRKRKDIAGSLSEYYPTPPWVTHRFIERVGLPNGTWLEPCAGNGDIIQAINDIRKPPAILWHANEIRPECAPRLLEATPNTSISDYLLWPAADGPKKYDVIITNPPFSLAMPIIRKSLELADHVAMLLRLNYVGSTERTAFFKEYMPDIYVIPERPSFDGKGSDSIEYAWFLWGQPEKRKRSKGTIELLDNTPLSIRKLHKPLDFKVAEQMQLL